MLKACKLCKTLDFKDVLSFSKCFFSDGSKGSEPLVKEECLNCGTVRTKLKISLHEFYQKEYQPSRNMDVIVVSNNEEMNRSQFVYAWIQDLISKDGLEKVKNILEIGCGQGYLLDKFHVDDKYGVEPSEEASGFAKNVASVRNIGYEQISDMEKYDFLLSYCVIEHIEDPNKFLKKNYNILNNGGRICIALPIQDKFNYDLVFADHIHHFSHNNFVKLLNINGFHVVNSELGRGSYTNIGMYICEKRETRKTVFDYIHNKNIQNIEMVFKNIDGIVQKYRDETIYAFGYGEIAKTILPYTVLEKYIINFVDDYSQAEKIITTKESKELFETIDKINLVLLVNPSHSEKIKSVYQDFSNINFLDIFESIEVRK